VGNQIVEAIRLHQRKSAGQAWADAVEMLRKAGLSDPTQRVHEYPHQMSGGMRQRVMIAMAISCRPALLIADEPTTALDVTIQAQILDLLDELQEQIGMSILLITHDLGVVSERADDVAVMYASRIAEVADSQKLFAGPLHPYTQGLLKSLPRLGDSVKRLQTIPGTVPEPLHFPRGCKFHPRCPIGNTDKRCQTVEPQLREVQPGRCVACWYAPGFESKKEYEEYESKYGKHKQLSAES
jgi:oligopeptide/dipeptide ABC transporter ATP-binding protein